MRLVWEYNTKQSEHMKRGRNEREGGRKSGIERRQTRRDGNKNKLAHIALGDSVWRLSGMERQSREQRLFGLTASYSAALRPHLECPPPPRPSFSLIYHSLALSSIPHRVQPPINKDTGPSLARNLRRLIPFPDELCIISSQSRSHKDAGQPESSQCWEVSVIQREGGLKPMICPHCYTL